MSAVSLNGGTLSLQTNLSIGSLVWNSSGTLALPELGKGDFLDVTGSLSLAGPSTNNFSLSQSALGSIPTELLGWGSTNSEFGTGNFSLPGVNNYYLSISNNALWAQILTNLYVGSNSTVAATNFISGSQLYFNTYVGFSSKASKNLLSVSGPNTLLRNITNLTVGVAGSGNSMVISNGGTVLDVNGSIGSASTSLSNSVLVTGAGSSWSNSGSVTIGNAGSGILTVTSGGNVVAQGGIMIAAQTGSSGTLGIGSLPSSAGSGTLTTPDITFGLGKGTILTSGTWQAGSNAILPGTPLFVDDPFQVALTNSTLNLVIPLGGLTNSGSFTYTFNRSGSSFYEIATTNGVNLQPIADTTWDNTSTNWHTNSGGPALVFAPDDNFLYNATFSATGTLTVPTNGVTANQVNFIDILDQNIGGGVINATSFTKSGSGLLNISNNLSLIGSFSNTGAGSANLSGTILSGSITQSGTGTLNLSGKNSYGGGTVLSGGTLAIGNNSAFGSGSLYVEGNGTLSGSSTLNVANPLTILGKSVLTVNVTGTSNSLSESGVIGGTGSLLKTGTGSVTLSGSNSFTGGATITQGILAASSLGSGALLIAPAKGNQAGFIDTLASGTLSLGAITMSGGSTLGIENPYGSILSSGAISITGTNNFIDLSGAWTNLGTYSLLTGSKLTGSGLKVLDLSGSFLGGADLLLGKTTNYGGLLYSFTDTSSALELSISPIQKVAMLPLASIYSSEGDVMSVNPGVLTLQAVPEPSAYPLLGLGVLALLSVLKLRRLSIRNSKTTRPNSGNIVSKMRF